LPWDRGCIPNRTKNTINAINTIKINMGADSPRQNNNGISIHQSWTYAFIVAVAKLYKAENPGLLVLLRSDRDATVV
jgi:hypothetical protein